jgi:hypothetical protein
LDFVKRYSITEKTEGTFNFYGRLNVGASNALSLSARRAPQDNPTGDSFSSSFVLVATGSHLCVSPLKRFTTCTIFRCILVELCGIHISVKRRRQTGVQRQLFFAYQEQIPFWWSYRHSV